MKNHRYVFFILIPCLTCCSRQRTGNIREMAEVAAGWKGKQIAPFDRPFSECVVFSLRKDSSLALSMIYELAPRSRVWSVDMDVLVHDGLVQWKGNEGVLSDGKDTLRVTREENGGQTKWLFVRDSSVSSLMRKLRVNTTGPYVYKPPQERNDGWLCGNLAGAGADEAKFVELIEEIRNGKHDDIHSFLIVKDSKLVLEEYFADNGRKHNPFIADLFREKVHDI